MAHRVRCLPESHACPLLQCASVSAARRISTGQPAIGGPLWRGQQQPLPALGGGGGSGGPESPSAGSPNSRGSGGSRGRGKPRGIGALGIRLKDAVVSLFSGGSGGAPRALE